MAGGAGVAGVALGAALGTALFVRAPTQAPAVAPPAAGMMGGMAEACPPGAPPALPPAMAGWSARTPLAAAASPAALGGPSLTPGRGVDAKLAPAPSVTYAATPGKPAPPGGSAGLMALTVPAAGTYAVGLSSAAWIDVVDASGASVASAAHGHGPACSGMRKVVDFALAPGRYVIQLSSADPTVGVLVFRR